MWKCEGVQQVMVCVPQYFLTVRSVYVCPLDTKDSEVSAVPANSQLTWKQGRQLLRQ